MSISARFQEVLEEGDLFFPLSKWPPIAKDYMLKVHKSNNERYYLMRFLCYNGLKPEIASNWILREGQYDNNALKDQQLMIKKAKDQAFYVNGRIFNMRYGRTDSLYDPPPSSEPHWESQPPPTPTPKTYGFQDLIERYPMPVRGPDDDDDEWSFQLSLWKAETRKFFKVMKQQGYVYVP